MLKQVSVNNMIYALHIAVQHMNAIKLAQVFGKTECIDFFFKNYEKEEVTMKAHNIHFKTDITEKSDYELSRIVFDNPYYYTQRHNPHFLALVDETFFYTPTQMHQLEQDLIDDLYLYEG
jgi:hypothetical protein